MALSTSLGAGDVACWGGLLVMGHGLGGLSASLGAGLVSLGAGDMAWFVGSLGASGIDELAPVWPQGGAFTGGLNGSCGGRV